MPTEGEIRGAMDRLHISRAEAETVDYAGDGVYVWGGNGNLWLGTLEGHRIALEPQVFAAVCRIRGRLVGQDKLWGGGVAVTVNG
jgi:hypothetical protein